MGRVKEEINGDFEPFVAEIDDEGVEIRLEKKEGGEDDGLGISSDDGFEESEENGSGEAGCLTRMTLVRIVLRAARSVPKSVKRNPRAVK